MLRQAVKYTSTNQRRGVLPNHKHVVFRLVTWSCTCSSRVVDKIDPALCTFFWRSNSERLLMLSTCSVMPPLMQFASDADSTMRQQHRTGFEQQGHATAAIRDNMQSLSALHLHAALMNILLQEARCAILRRRRGRRRRRRRPYLSSAAIPLGVSKCCGPRWDP